MITLLLGLVWPLILPSMEEDPLKKLIQKIELYNQTFPREKTFLHVDRPYYSTGETIWMKAYLVDGVLHQPDTLSIPLYVDLLEKESGMRVARRILKLNQGTGTGDMTLPDTLAPGLYRLRAYTRWMQNLPPDLFFNRDILVQPAKKSQVVVPNTQESHPFDFQLFPEGGQLLAGVDNRIAFKATQPSGKGVPVTGWLISTNQDTLQTFQSQHQGMGFFYWRPTHPDSVRIVVQDSLGQQQMIPVPTILNEGVSWVVDNVSNKNLIRINVQNRLPNSALYIIGQSRGVVFYAGTIPAGVQNTLVNIPKDKFPEGVAQITVFDAAHRPHAERLVFIPREQEIQFQLKLNQKEFRTRQEVILDIEAKNKENQPVEGNFSLSLVDSRQVLGLAEMENLVSNLLLTSEVKGAVYQPNYYFDPTNRKAAYHLDILLMTQGWRKFTWKNVLQEAWPATPHMLERGLVISGEVARPSGKAIGEEAVISLLIGQDSTQQFLTGSADASGDFMFYGLDFQGNQPVMIQAKDASGEDLKAKIRLNPEANPVYSAQILPTSICTWPSKSVSSKVLGDFNLNHLSQSANFRLDQGIDLNEVQVVGKVIKEPVRDPRVLYARPEAVVKGDASPSALTVFDLLRGRVAGVTVVGDRMNPKVSIRTMGQSMQVSSNPLFLLDGAPVTMETLLALDIQLVDRVEVVKSLQGSVMYGDQARGGIISVFSKTGRLDQETSWQKDRSGTLNTEIEGYYMSKSFYSPRYDQPDVMIRPDFRTTLFWAPILKTNQEGKATLRFFTSDIASDFRLDLQGFSSSGLLGATTEWLRVR